MRLLIFFLLLSLGADAQIIRANPFYRPTAAAAQFLLDAYPNAAAAYSLRKLKASYSGSAIRIRRDSTGNAETDIGFTANGDLDTTAIKNHCRNNSCMVTTWYNQGDSTAVDFTQTVAANQPIIISAGTIQRRAGQPSLRFAGDDFMDVANSTTGKFRFLHIAGQAAVFITLQAGVVANPNLRYVILNNNQVTSTAQRGYGLAYDDRASQSLNNSFNSTVTRGVTSTYTSNNFIDNFFPPDTLALITNLLDNSTATAADRNILYRNATNEQKNNISTDAAAANINTSANLRLGRVSGATTFTLNGYVSELILYPTDQSSNRTGIETNINNYYGLW